MREYILIHWHLMGTGFTVYNVKSEVILDLSQPGHTQYLVDNLDIDFCPGQEESLELNLFDSNTLEIRQGDILGKSHQVIIH